MKYGSFRYTLRMASRREPAIWCIIRINIGIALLCWLTSIIASAHDSGFSLASWLSVPASMSALASSAWSPLTYMFTQTHPLHLVFNMLWLLWFGQVLSEAAGQRHIWRGYIIGGLSGAFFFIVSKALIPSLGGASLSGASAAVVAVMAEAALRRPDREFRLLLIGNVKLKWLAAVSLGLLLLGLGGGNAGGQAAHIGGALAGCGLFFFDRRKKQRQHAFPAKNAGKVVKAMQSYRSSIDRLDELLDKIKLSGYDSLTSKEKRELQHLSERKR